jgi:plastocyanin
MFERFTRKSMAVTGAALLAALGVSGVAVAQSSNGTSQTPSAQSAPEKPGVESNAPENSAKDGDNVQYTPPGESNGNVAAASSKRSAAKKSHTKKSHTRKSHTARSAAEAPGTEQSPGSESGGEAPGSETANNDGPGGHADEPGNPNADHQFQGNE